MCIFALMLYTCIYSEEGCRAGGASLAVSRDTDVVAFTAVQRGDVARRAVSSAAVLMEIPDALQRCIETQCTVSWCPGNERRLCAAVQRCLNPSVVTRCCDINKCHSSDFILLIFCQLEMGQISPYM